MKEKLQLAIKKKTKATLNHQTKGSKSFASQVKRKIAYFDDGNIKDKNFLQTTLLSVI
jgi:hypothetical protein